MSYVQTAKQAAQVGLCAGPAQHIMAYGGSRSGKTFNFCRIVAIRAGKAPGSRHAIWRYRYNHIMASIWADTWPKMMKLCFPGVPYESNKVEGVIRLSNGSEIWMGGLDDKERVEKVLGMEFCVDPASKVLTADMRWIEAGKLAAGQELVGFPEHLDGHLTLQPSTIERHKVIEADKYRIVTDRGETIVSAQHKFVAMFDDRRHRNFRSLSWKKAEDLKAGDQLRYSADPWEVGESKEDGWFAGMLDGEGWVSAPSRQAGVAQRAGACLDAIKAWLECNGVDYAAYPNVSGGYEPCWNVRSLGIWASMRMLGIAQPKRLDARGLWSGVRAFISGERHGGHIATVISVEPIGRGPVVSMSTSTKTFISDGFLSHNCTLYFNEVSQISYDSVSTAISRLAQQTGLKLKAFYDCNPPGKRHWSYRQFIEKVDPESGRALGNPDNYASLSMNPIDNAHNLAPEYLATLENLPARKRKRFLLGEFGGENEHALWTYDTIKHVPRIGNSVQELIAALNLARIVVAIDPAVSNTPGSDEHGIIVAAKDHAGNGYVLEDGSMRGKPDEWAKEVQRLFVKYSADAVVAETNQGGDLVEANIRTVMPYAPVIRVHAAKGKAIRAEPIAALYAQGKVFHVGDFEALEDQQVEMTIDFDRKAAGYSPDRVDALVWALTDLLIEEEGGGWSIGHF